MQAPRAPIPKVECEAIRSLRLSVLLSIPGFASRRKLLGREDRRQISPGKEIRKKSQQLPMDQPI